MRFNGIIQHKVKLGLLISLLMLYSVCNTDARLGYSPIIQERQVEHVNQLTLPNFHLIKNAFHNTGYMGTTEHPTIDGGVVNFANGMPINQIRPEPHKRKRLPLITKSRPESNAVEHKNSNSKPFEDQWATSNRVKQLLKSAAEDGKLKFVLERAEALKLPAVVAVVPMVESNYQNKAVSSQGAVGAWQLMPAVAKDYGISNHERFEFNSSTQVALKLIRDLHQQFGNWTLVFAAYNAGAQRVRTALEKKPTAKSVDELDLPSETKQYVKRIQAIVSILSAINLYES